MVCWLTLPAVERKYERVHMDAQFEQVRELPSQREGRDALALLHDFRRAIGRRDLHKQVDMVWLDRQRQNLPTVLRALTLDQLATARRD
jgi:hypothetical protein